jgi:ArsR family transcriptional regulator
MQSNDPCATTEIGYRDVVVGTLIDDQATLSNIRSGLRWLQETVQPGQIDTVVIYLSGHGLSLDRGRCGETYTGQPIHNQEFCGIISMFHEITKGLTKTMIDRDDQPNYARMFKALGDPTRLRIFSFLRACCCPVAIEKTGDVRPVDGPTVGEVCCRITGAERINSTISHHLKELRLAGLITIERRGKNMVCGVSREAVSAMAAYLHEASITSQKAKNRANERTKR